MQLSLGYADFYKAVTSASPAPTVLYATANGNYYLYATLSSSNAITCVIIVGGADAAQFESDLMPTAQTIP